MPESALTPIASPPVIRQTTHQVLQHPDYDLQSLEGMRIAWDWLADLLQPIFNFLDGLYGLSPVLFYAFVTVLVLVLAALVAHIVYSFKTAMRRKTQAAHYLEAEDAAGTRPETWEHRAQLALDAGEYLEAVRFILTATLLRLEQSRKGKLRRGATNREYLRRYQASPAYAPLSQIVEITDSRWYGGADCTRADVETCLHAHQQVQASLATGQAHV
jgi:hypothetical protein